MQETPWETQSAVRRRRYRQVMALINPPSLSARTRTREDRAARVLWMVEKRSPTIIRRSRKPATGPCMFDHH